MSTINNAQLADESDGDDCEYVPSPRAKGKRRASDSGSSASGSDTDEPSKRVKLDAELKELADERRRAAIDQLKEFAKDDGFASPARGDVTSGEEMVRIQRARRFAGETVYESVTLKASDPEAIAYLAQQQASSIKLDSIPGAESSAKTDREQPTVGKTAATSTTVQPAAKPKPVRRKPRASLEAMSASMAKGKKMTTLEKSQMDWNAHTAADGLEHELERNRKGAGFLDRQAFLDRVSDRRQG